MTPSERDAFDRLSAAGLRGMQGQLSPDGFRRAEASLVKIFEAMPLGVEDPMPRGLEEIVSGRSAWVDADALRRVLDVLEARVSPPRVRPRPRIFIVRARASAPVW